MPAGRPSSYTAETASIICDRLASGETLRAICRDDAMPDQTTVFRWLRNFEEFRLQYTHARDDQADTWADEIVEIADTGSADDTQRARLRVDARKWLMAKSAPKKYGERLTQELTGKDGASLIPDGPLDNGKASLAVLNLISTALGASKG